MSDQNVFKKQLTIDANDEYYLKYGQPPGNRQSLRTIQFTDVDSCDATVTLKGRPRGSSATPVAIPYEKLHLNGSAADGSKVSTGITGNSLIRVDDSGLELVLSVASRTQGSITVDQHVQSES